MIDLPLFDDDAACVSVGVEAFFPPDNIGEFRGKGYGNVPPAIVALCASCPWHDPCYDYALRYDVQGIWAGTSPSRRDKERAALGIIPIPVVDHQPGRVRQLEDGAA